MESEFFSSDHHHLFLTFTLYSLRWSTKNPPSVIKCIHRVENIELWRAYCAKRDSIERLRGDANEKWLWHGTRSLSPEVIAKEGFDFRVANPGSYGRGAYFAYSVNYSASGYQYLIPVSASLSSYQADQHFGGGAPFATHYYGKKGKRSRYYPPPSSSAWAPPSHSNHHESVITNSLMKFPEGAGAGDGQVILARVCIGKTNLAAVSGVSPSFLSVILISFLGSHPPTKWI